MTETFQSLINISQQIGIRPSALSNWQKRYPDFPAPRVLRGQRRLYHLDDIKEFMDRHQLFAREESATVQSRDPIAHLVSTSLDLMRGTSFFDLEGLRLIAAIAYLATKHPTVFEAVINGKHNDQHLDEVVPLARQCVDVVNQRRELIPVQLLEIWKSTDVKEAPLVGASLRQVLRKMSDNKFSGQFYTPPAIARLIYKLAPGLEILDVCSGSGEILNQYRRGARRLVGLEISEQTAFFHNIIAQLEGDPVEIICENTLTVCHQEWMENGFDAVVCDAPMGLRLSDGDVSSDDLRWAYGAQSRRNTAEDYWIQTVLAYLRPSFSEPPLRGIVTLRAGWFFEAAESQMRNALIKAGVVEAVVSMGGGCLPSTSIPFGLLILRKSGVANRPVRFVDASEAGEIVRGRRVLSAQLVDQIVVAVNGDAKHDPRSQIRVVDVPISEIVANSAILQSSRYLAPTDEIPTPEVLQFNLDIKNRNHQSLLADYLGTVDMTTAAVDASSRIVSNTAEISELLVSNLMLENSPIQILFKNRLKGSQWTPEEIFSDDVVVNLAGSAVGQVVRGLDLVHENLQWNRLWILRSRSREVTASYLYAWARFGDLQQQLRLMRSGTTIPTVSKTDIARIRILLPSLDVQREIAALAHGMLQREKVFRQLENSEAEILELLETSFLVTTQTYFENQKKGNA